MKILVLNGPNLNMLGIREPGIYGSATYDDLVSRIVTYCSEKGIDVVCSQSNHEGELVDMIQQAYFDKVDGIVINPGAYTHTSVAILDALKAVAIPTVEVHLTDVDNREEYRKVSYVSEYAFLRVTGRGFAGYFEAMDALLARGGKPCGRGGRARRGIVGPLDRAILPRGGLRACGRGRRGLGAGRRRGSSADPVYGPGRRPGLSAHSAGGAGAQAQCRSPDV